MKASLAAACAVASILAAPASAHRLDEYLQAATIGVERDRVNVEMRLTPGVAVFDRVLAGIDVNGDGIVSAAEERAYVERVRRDLTLTVDGHPLRLRAVSWKYAGTAEMKKGLGEIWIDFSAPVPRGGEMRRLILKNRHQSWIAAYLVNCLVPSDPEIQVTGQRRSFQQSGYELDYLQNEQRPASPAAAWRPDGRGWLAMAGLLLAAPLAWRRWRRGPASVRRGATDGTP